MLGRYRIVGTLGAGSVGVACEAMHAELEKRVVVKTLLPTHSRKSDVVRRFLREGENAARIVHPNVVEITDVGMAGELPFLVMEYLEGRDLSLQLRTEFSDGKQLPFSQIADIMAPVIAGVAAAHDQRVIHRDLKPANIFLARNALHHIVPKVIDFGMSKLDDDAQSDLTTDGTLLGTLAFMPPEQIRDSKRVDASADQYALAVVLYLMVTGQRPFVRDSMASLMHAILEQACSPPRFHRHDVPRALEAAIVRAMHKDRMRRYGSVRELGAAILEFASPAVRDAYATAFRTSAPVERCTPAEPSLSDGSVSMVSGKTMTSSASRPVHPASPEERPTVPGFFRQVAPPSERDPSTLGRDAPSVVRMSATLLVRARLFWVGSAVVGALAAGAIALVARPSGVSPIVRSQPSGAPRSIGPRAASGSDGWAGSPVPIGQPSSQDELGRVDRGTVRGDGPTAQRSRVVGYPTAADAGQPVRSLRFEHPRSVTHRPLLRAGGPGRASSTALVREPHGTID